MEENKLFKPDQSKKLYTITIEVMENIAQTSVEGHSDYKPKYHEVIGALETQKNHIIFNQREENMKYKLVKKKK